MREIKFRVWDKTNSKFDNDIGLYSNGELGDFSECFHNIVGKNGEYYVIQQYTGSKDKNGKEIYEGDIVTLKVRDEKGHQYDMIGEVDFNEFEYVVYTNDPLWPCVSFHVIKLSDLEIIGNVYDNPDLLNTNA